MQLHDAKSRRPNLCQNNHDPPPLLDPKSTSEMTGSLPGLHKDPKFCNIGRARRSAENERCCSSFCHTRVTQEVGVPICHAATPKVVATAFRDALECIFATPGRYSGMNLGSILVNDGRGQLVDWDHAKAFVPAGEYCPYRMGTWQFLSVDFLQEPRRPHKIQDAVESAFWVLLYVCLHFLRHDFPSFNITFFDERALRAQRNNDVLSVGGRWKFLLLIQNRLAYINWDCSVPLKNLLIKFSDLLGEYHALKELPSYREAAKTCYAKIGNSPEMLGLFEVAMEQEGWLPDDIQFKTKTTIGQEEKDDNIASVSQQAIDLPLPSSLTGWSTPPDTDGLPRTRRRPTRYNNTREVIQTSRGSSKRSMPVEKPEIDEDNDDGEGEGEDEPQAAPSNHPAKRARRSTKTSQKAKGKSTTGNAAASESAPRHRLGRTPSCISTGSAGRGRTSSRITVSLQPSRRSNRLRSQGPG
ncbi:hypothetical protein K474DRAFT_1664799 [Panus rudis PR-1116 ss-1]|nr:hypothetical protein K474DRAFT_1664799 [Panus rudis PR-1116 ss-1]